MRVKMEEVYYVFVKTYRNKHKSKLVRNFGLLIIIHESMFSNCSPSTLGVGKHRQRVRDETSLYLIFNYALPLKTL